MKTPTLIVLGGLPGTGKTTIARELAAMAPCAYLRIDVIERAVDAAFADRHGDIGPAGYAIAHRLAESNLALGLAVVADCVNPLAVTRAAWRAVADAASCALVEVEVVCPDPAEHRRRVEGRRADIPGAVLPSWEAVRHHAYEPWTTRRLVIDSARTGAHDAALQILAHAAPSPAFD